MHDIQQLLEDKRAKARLGGGQKRIDAQHTKGKLTARPEALPSVDDLFRYARSRLSPQKTPERWFFVPQYPLTPTGKIQKNVLAEWIAEGRIAPIDWVRPTTSA